MPLLPRKHFTWKEPKVLLKISDAFERSTLQWWRRPLWGLVAAAMLMSSWSIARLNPHKQPPAVGVAILIALVGGVFFAYIAPWMVSLCPSVVHFYDSSLVRVRGNAHRQIRYSDIASFSWRVQGEFAILMLKHRRNNRHILLGVPPEISKDAVSQFLLDHNVMSEPSAQQPLATASARRSADLRPDALGPA